MKANRKVLFFLLIMATLVIISGCGSGGKEAPATEKEIPAAENSGQGEVLEGYPIGTLPLYKYLKMENSLFTVRYDDKVNLGKNYYMVNFQSEASMDETSTYYHSLLTEIDPDYDAIDFFEGAIGEQKVLVSLLETEDNTVAVSLSIGQKVADYVEENPYFSSYPGDVVLPVNEVDLTELTYNKRFSAYEDKILIGYLKKYETSLSIEEIKDFYESKYSMADSFALTEDEYSSIYFWKNEGYECQVIINTNNDNAPRYYQTEITKQM